MKRWPIAVLAAMIAGAGWFSASAGDLVISGAGTIPLGRSITTVSGEGTKLEAFLEKRTGEVSFQSSLTAFLFRRLALPPGAAFFGEKNGDFPPGRLHVYQMRTEDTRGVYVAEVLTLSGTPEEWFPKPSKASRFWFSSGGALSKEGDNFLLSLPRDEKSMEQSLRDGLGSLSEKERRGFSAEVLSYQPWTKYETEHGIDRWGSDVRLLIRKGTVTYPLWVNASFFKGDRGTWTAVAVIGNHMSSRRMAESLMYGLFRWEEAT